MTFNQMRAAVEAILFAAGEAVDVAKIAGAFDIETEDARTLLISCAESLDERESGLCILQLGDRYQLCTRRDYAEQIRSVLEMKRNTPLSAAAFEVLAVIAYNQPVTKSYIEQVRGVDCSGVVATLCQKGLVEEKGRLDLPGRPLLYGTTPEFLKCFCLTSLSELPELPEKVSAPEAETAGEIPEAAPAGGEQPEPELVPQAQEDFEFDGIDIDVSSIDEMYE